MSQDSENAIFKFEGNKFDGYKITFNKFSPNDRVDLTEYMTGFKLEIAKFNEMYRIPEVSPEIANARLYNFRSILKEECEELGAIFANDEFSGMKVDLADLLGDIIVYCASEAKRWNIPIDRVLHIIMQSNFSKLNEDGSATFDERGKLLKGPNYWKPEPKIAKLLAEMGDMK